jgi:copper homeostasis protein
VRRVLLEVCVDTADGLAAAIAGGADRIELCSALELGGLTPSPGLMAIAAKAEIPVYAMIRPRGGDFVYSAAELDQMRRDMDAARMAGMAGVVFGASRSDHNLDEDAMRVLARQAEGLGTTLHRAVDLAPHMLAAVDAAAGLGFERILSSGGKKTALEGLELLHAMHERAKGRISVMPGSGVNAGNVAQILAAIPAIEIHASCSAAGPEPTDKALAFGFAQGPIRVTAADKVAKLRAALEAFSR